MKCDYCDWEGDKIDKHMMLEHPGKVAEDPVGDTRDVQDEYKGGW